MQTLGEDGARWHHDMYLAGLADRRHAMRRRGWRAMVLRVCLAVLATCLAVAGLSVLVFGS